MSPFKKSNNLAARMGRWSAGHRKTAIFGWLAFVVLAVFIGMQVGTKQIDNADTNTGQARKADHILAAAGFDHAKRFDEYILVSSKTHTVSDPAFKAAIHDAIAATVASPLTTHVRSPYAPANAGQITKDGHTAYVAYDIDGDQKVAYKEVDKVLAGVDKAQQANPGFAIRETGARECRQGPRRDVHQAAQAGGRALPPADPADPARRVRRDRRGGDPAAPRDLGRAGHAGPARPAEQPDPDGQVRRRGRAARRARSRRRLLALLPQA